jgi:hypothetical protein
MESSGLSDWLAAALGGLRAFDVLLIVAALILVTLVATEAMSNVATLTAMLPVVAAFAAALGVNPLLLVFPVSIAASLGFMLPIATGPNAIAYADGQAPLRRMLRYGFILNLAGVAAILLVNATLAPGRPGLTVAAVAHEVVGGEVQRVLGILQHGLAHRLVAHAHPGLVHALGIARQQRVPGRQGLALVQPPVGAAARQPGHGFDVLEVKFDAVGNVGLAVRIVLAEAGLLIQQLTGDPRRNDLARVFVLEPDQAAQAAAVAQGFPFLRVHLVQGLGFPEGAWLGQRLRSRVAAEIGRNVQIRRKP